MWSPAASSSAAVHRSYLASLWRVENNVTELTLFSFWRTGNEQAAMHYSRHRLTALVTCVTTLTYASNSDQ